MPSPARTRCGQGTRSVDCGVAAGGPAGFMLVDNQGKWSGPDIDVCRAVAAVLFGDSEKVK